MPGKIPLEDFFRNVEKSNVKLSPDGRYLAWMEPWQKTWGPMAGMPEFLEKHRPMKSTRLGGDISYLYRIDPTWSVGTQPLPPGDIQLRDFSG